MMRRPRNPERVALEHRLEVARREAELLIERLAIRRAPVDPIDIAHTERRQLRLCAGNYKNAFDGRLEFHSSKQRFLCFYNTKYDRPSEGKHAPRTRFSLAHELGHFFIEEHHEYLRSGGKSHPSRSEFVRSSPVEQQADCFAAHLLMPDRLVRPVVNQEEISIDLIRQVADSFETSFVSASLRVVECSDFYGGIAAIRGGELAWVRLSVSLIRRGVYPGERGPLRSENARSMWQEFLVTASVPTDERAGWARDWFRVYDDELKGRLPVTEAYLAAPVMDTLLVVLSVPEDEIWVDEDDY